MSRSTISITYDAEKPKISPLLFKFSLANQQEALYWELRAALSLAEHWNMQGRRNEACTLLAPFYQRFTEGLASPILVRANSLLRGGEAVV